MGATKNRTKLTCEHITRGRSEVGTGPLDARRSTAMIWTRFASVQCSWGKTRVSAVMDIQ